MARLPFAVAVAPDAAEPLGRAISAIVTASHGVAKADNTAAKATLTQVMREQAVILAEAGYDPADIDIRVRNAFSGSGVAKGTGYRYALALADAVFILSQEVVTPLEFAELSVAKIETVSADARDSGYLESLNAAKLSGAMLAKLAKIPGKRSALAELSAYVVAECKRHGAKEPAKREKNRADLVERNAGAGQWPNPAPVHDATEIAAAG